jgi:predicted metal-dependent hydrolase
MDRRAAARALPEQLSLFGAPGRNGLVRREVILAGRRIEYRFARRRRRTIGLTVDADGLSVSAPRNAAWREIENFLLEQGRWVLARLDEWAGVPRAAPVFGLDGERLPLFGETLRLAVTAGRSEIRREGSILRVATPAPSACARVVALLLRWLRAQALAALTPRTAHYAARLGRGTPAVRLSNAQRQWGLCTAEGEIRYSWRLVHLAPALSDYVIAHEVAHLVEMNHSKRFWRLVESLYPDWRDARARLEREGAGLPSIGRAS